MQKEPKYHQWAPYWDLGWRWHIEVTPRGFRLLKVLYWRPGPYAGLPYGVRYTHHTIPLYWWPR